ncbi:hypothetical protein FB107DRAFT_279545 [Schizophyllum commune]
MDGAALTDAKALVFRFICSSDGERYDIIDRDLAILLDYNESCSDDRHGLHGMLLITACCMYARYLATVSAFGKAYRDVHGPDPASSGESLADRHHLMAERAGYPAGAARRFFDALVRDKKLIYRRVVLGIPFPELSTVERLNFTEDQLFRWRARSGAQPIHGYAPAL